MKYIITTLTLLYFLSYSAFSQSGDDDAVFVIVEKMPVFPGGEQGLLDYLASIEYPNEAKEKAITGQVFVKLIIDEEGEVTNVEIVKSVHPILDEAVIKHIEAMPRWEPGKQRGKPVKVQYVIPLTFNLTDSKPQEDNQKVRSKESKYKKNNE